MTALQNPRTNLLSEEDTKWWRQPPRLFHPPLSLFPQLFVFSFSSFFSKLSGLDFSFTFPSQKLNNSPTGPHIVTKASQCRRYADDVFTKYCQLLANLFQLRELNTWWNWTWPHSVVKHVRQTGSGFKLKYHSNSCLQISLHPETEYGHKATQVCECTITDQGKLCKENSQVIR